MPPSCCHCGKSDVYIHFTQVWDSPRGISASYHFVGVHSSLLPSLALQPLDDGLKLVELGWVLPFGCETILHDPDLRQVNECLDLPGLLVRLACVPETSATVRRPCSNSSPVPTVYPPPCM